MLTEALHGQYEHGSCSGKPHVTHWVCGPPGASSSDNRSSPASPRRTVGKPAGPIPSGTVVARGSHDDCREEIGLSRVLCFHSKAEARIQKRLARSRRGIYGTRPVQDSE